MKRTFMLILAILLVLPLVTAEDVTFRVVPVNKSIIQGSSQYAAFDLEVTNPFSYTDRFEITLKEFDWNVWSDPFSDFAGGGIDVQADDTYTAHLFLAPRSMKPLGHYSLPIVLKSKMSGEKYSSSLEVDIMSGIPPNWEYAVGILASIIMPIDIDPREDFEVAVQVHNLFPRNISDLTIKLNSNLIFGETVFNLDPLAKKIVRFPVEIPDYQPPLTDDLEVLFLKDGEVVKTEKTRYSIISFSDLTVQKDELTKSFLKFERDLVYYNDGNVPTVYTSIVKVNPVQRMFIRTNIPYYTVKNSEGTFMAWELEMDPKGSAEITIIQNYRALFYFGIVVLIIVLFYIFMRSSLTLNKEAKVMEIKDGAISMLRVLINVKNRTKKPLTNIMIADRVTHIASIVKEFDVGTLKPDKIVQDARGGTLIKWTIPMLEPYEERIISYKIKSGLQVLGKFSLPSALAKYKTPGGSNLKTKSNMGKIVQ